MIHTRENAAGLNRNTLVQTDDQWQTVSADIHRVSPSRGP